MNWLEEYILSAETDRSSHNEKEIENWLNNVRESIHVSIKEKPLKELSKWDLNPKTGFLEHDTGKFFKVKGLKIETNFAGKSYWEQPILDQNEIGLLGFICKHINGILHFLCQAKIEPGNVNTVQLSPTVQATRSNLDRVHQGADIPYVKYFLKADKRNIIVDNLQTEQSARFYRKRNRNVVIYEPNVIEVNSTFIWMTLAQISRLLAQGNVVNMDTRSVLSMLPLQTMKDKLQRGSFSTEDSLQKPFLWEFQQIRGLLSSIIKLKSKFYLRREFTSLSQILDWKFENGRINHIEHRFFSIIGVEVNIANREVSKWDQPMIKPANLGLCGILICIEENDCFVLVQKKLESGSFDSVELAPSVQLLTGGKEAGKRGNTKFLNFFLEDDKGKVLYTQYQSEEGGRFFREENENMIVMVSKSDIPECDSYSWEKLSTLLFLNNFPNLLNVQLRNLLCILLYSLKVWQTK